MEFFGYICAILVGISLGVLGSGGSILTVPIMVYMMRIPPLEATGYSLFVVGVTSAAGGFSYIQKKLVDMKTAAVFAIPSIISVFFTRKILLPKMPDPVLIGSVSVTKDLFILYLFAILMIVVAYNMIRPIQYKEPDESEIKHYNYPWLIFIGLISGMLTGFLGVGGGFIIIPALVLFAKIPIRMSVGTSLLIIAFNSFTGFTEEIINNHDKINYSFLLMFSLLSVTGIFVGFRLSLLLQPTQLKKIFGWFILVMGICVLIKEIYFGL